MVRGYVESLRLVCHVQLVDGSLLDTSSMNSEDRRQRIDLKGNRKVLDRFLDVLVGQRVGVPHILSDPDDGISKLFFVFPDLGIRLAGTWISIYT
jgi:hypothetical protein